MEQPNPVANVRVLRVARIRGVSWDGHIPIILVRIAVGRIVLFRVDPRPGRCHPPRRQPDRAPATGMVWCPPWRSSPSSPDADRRHRPTARDQGFVATRDLRQRPVVGKSSSRPMPIVRQLVVAVHVGVNVAGDIDHRRRRDRRPGRQDRGGHRRPTKTSNGPAATTGMAVEPPEPANSLICAAADVWAGPARVPPGPTATAPGSPGRC